VLRSQIVLTMDEYRELEDEMVGICFNCGNRQDGCEPDACNYTCDDCREKQVFGVPELLIMGRIDIVG
jgi:hypothetical protein